VNAKSWEAEITSAKTSLTQAEIALKLAKKKLNDATIEAPISGIISQRFLDLGGMAAPTAPLFEIVDVGTVKATVDLIESQLSRIRLDQKAEITIDGINTTIIGEISYISPTLQPVSRTATVEFNIQNTEGNLKPGMFAKVKLPVEIRPDAVLIPRVSLIEDAITKKRNVFIVEAGVSKQLPVEIGLTNGGDVEIRKGLNGGESVIVAGQHSLKVGDSVTVVNP
jgi:membrane fusion protein (multidrug efflux system)